MSGTNTAAGRYQQLSSSRQSFLDRAREAAILTIPTLVPPDGHGPQTKYYTPYQGIGARGVNNLGAKLLLALLPPNSPFFRLMVDDFTLEEMTKQEGMRAEVERALNKIERSVMNEIETTALRVPAFEAIKHLIVAGNGLLYMPRQGGARFFRLDRFVVHRDPMGNVLEIITEEDVAPDALPEALVPKDSKNPQKIVKLYTWVRREAKAWKIHQEVNGVTIPKSQGSYPLDKSPWIPLRWTQVDGEDYGRGYVEEYLGDLRSLEGLSKAIVEGSAAAARILLLVNPNGTTKAKDLAEAPNGSVRIGNKEDVTVLGLEKFNDFRIALETVDRIESRLGFAFLLNTSVQRAGERVTAEEIRFMAGELETALGGSYAILSQEFQLPLVNVLMDRMEKAKRLPALPKDLIKPSIITGIEALGRGNDLSKLDSLVIGAAQALGPEAVAGAINADDYMKRRATALGMDATGLIKTPEQRAAEQQQAMMQQMMDRLGPKGMDIVRDQLKPETEGGAQAQAAPAE